MYLPKEDNKIEKPSTWLSRTNRPNLIQRGLVLYGNLLLQKNKGSL
jgi:hypothetical protein